MSNETLTPEEYEAVTAAFIERLRDRMGTAGCNDLFTEEFPQSICDRFHADFEVLSAWKNTRAAAHRRGWDAALSTAANELRDVYGEGSLAARVRVIRYPGPESK